MTTTAQSHKTETSLPYHWAGFLLLAVLLVAGFWVHLVYGEIDLQVSFLDDVVSIITGSPEADTSNLKQVILGLRASRWLLAALVGGSLAVSGYLMQIIFNNPLVDPFTTGSASAAALGANLTIVGLVPMVLPLPIMVPVMGVVFCLLVTSWVLVLGEKLGRGHPGNLLLAGIAMSSLLGAINSLATYWAGNENRLKSIIFWAMGGFGAPEVHLLSAHTILFFVSVLMAILLHKHTALLSLGRARARQLGMKSNGLFWLVLLICAVLVGLSVAQSGLIGFIGLMVPHLVRGFYGGGKKYGPVLAALAGAVACTWADLLARWLYPPAGIPVGIVTSLVGLPFFVYLLAQRRHRIF